MQSLTIHPWCGLLLLLCAACTPGKAGTTDGPTTTTTTTAETTAETTTETTAETTTTSTTTAEATAPTSTGEACPLEEAASACCCFAHSSGCEEPTEVLCEATLACDDILVMRDGDMPVVENPAALECALTALRDRTPGQLRVIYHWGMPELMNEWTFLYVQADGTVFENRGARLDDFYADDLAHRSLQPAEVFEQCLQESDSAARLDCVEQAGSGEPLETCLGMCGIF